MQGLDIEEVRLAGKPKVEVVVRTDKTIRYPTEARTLQSAIDMCVKGDHIAILPGVYNEAAVIHVDLDMYREGTVGEVVFVSRHDTTLLVEGCTVSLVDIGLCVEEGALMHHALQVDRGCVHLDGCDLFGGLYTCFACGESTVEATQTRFHAAYSFGLTLLNSSAKLYDCFIFKNKEDGVNVCGGTSRAYFYRCRISDNACNGVHVHTGADAEVTNTELVRNGQHGVAVTGSDDQFARSGEGELAFSCASLEDCKVRNNEWSAIFVLDGSAKIQNCDLRKNGRGALNLASSKSSVQKEVDRACASGNIDFFDVEYYNSFQETGFIELEGQNQGLRPDGQNEFTQPDRLPLGWSGFSKARLLELFKACPMDVQKRLHGHPQGWHEGLKDDPQAAIKIKAELKGWIERDNGMGDDDEINQTAHDFLTPLGLGHMVAAFEEIGCSHVRDLMSMRNHDLLNVGIKDPQDRKVLLSRLAVNEDMGRGPKYIRETNLNALIESTKYQAKRGEQKGTYKEWRKLREFFIERCGHGTSGAKLDKSLRDLYGEIDLENVAGQDGIDPDELRIGLQRFGINMASVDLDILIEEAIPGEFFILSIRILANICGGFADDLQCFAEGEETLSFGVFCTIVQYVLRT